MNHCILGVDLKAVIDIFCLEGDTSLSLDPVANPNFTGQELMSMD